HRAGQLGAVGTQQIHRRRLALPLRQQQAQAPDSHVLGHVQPGLVDQSLAGQGPAPHHVGIVADAIAGDRQGQAAAAPLERPAVVYPAAELVEQAIVLAQVVRLARLAALRQVARRGAEHSPVVRRQRQGDQA
ncbi:hypothetical protein UF32_23325, partial [Vibrio parahaemolyticus]